MSLFGNIRQTVIQTYLSNKAKSMKEYVSFEEMRRLDKKQLPVILRQKAGNAKEEQLHTLLEILDASKDTEFGKKYDFAGIKSIEDYQAKVPVTTYDDYKGYIDKIVEGEEDILFPGKPKAFGTTSGTTGEVKIYPESILGDAAKTMIVGLRTIEIALNFPPLMAPDAKILTFTNSLKVDTGTKVKAFSASAQAADQTPAALKKKFVVPSALLNMEGIVAPDIDYCTELLALKERNIVALVCNNVVHFNKMMLKINEDPELYLNDIEKGTISGADFTGEQKAELAEYFKADPERAAELRRIYQENGKFTVAALWPRFAAVGCWLSSSVGRGAKEFKDLFPKGTIFWHWGYGATEGKFDIPVEAGLPGGIPALFGVFFEFLENGKTTPVTIDKTEPDKVYEIVITTYSGLYRYNLHDVVRVYTGKDGLPRMEFLCKSYDSIVINGITLTAGELTTMIEKYEEKMHIFIRYFTGEEKDGKLLVKAEPKGVWDRTDFEKYLKAELSRKGIPLYGVDEYEQGERDRKLVIKFAGKSINQTKLLVFK